MTNALILDTDIGSDVDDAMALALILGCPNVELVGVTTVYGDTLLRSRLAQRYAGLANRRLEVFAGLEAPSSGREVWWAGHEGTLHDDLDTETVSGLDAVGFLTREAASRPGQIDIVAIGPLTNIAAALDADPEFERNVRALWIMGGNFVAGEPEHNFRSDATAAARVFSSAIPTVVSGLEVTSTIQVDTEHLARLAAAGRMGAALARDIDQWWRYWDTPWSVPHDPITVLSLVQPELFTLSESGTISIVAEGGERDGLSAFTPTPNGTTRLVTDLNREAVTEAMISGICAAGS